MSRNNDKNGTTMDERWAKAFKAKRIMPINQTKSGTGHANDGPGAAVGKANHMAQAMHDMPMRRSQPFKATGHKGGISRQGS